MSNRIQSLASLVVIASLLFPWASYSPYTTAQAGSHTSAAGSSGLFRTQLTFPDSAARPRLEKLGVTVLSSNKQGALVLATAAQLEALARLRFAPSQTEELSDFVTAHQVDKPWLVVSIRATLKRAAAGFSNAEKARSNTPIADRSLSSSDLLVADSSLKEALTSFTPEQTAALADLTSLDDDADGLTNTQETWWCTDPLNADSDNDGVRDGVEVQVAKDWLANKAATPPASGKPFAGWPPSHPGCNDDDQDSVPDQAERWELGLNMNLESTDRDKFDDGQELFGSTYCPGSGGFCGYGLLPRSEDWGTIFAQMPSWVKAPGNHPLVAAYPVPEIDLVPSSLNVQTVTTVTTDHTITSGTARSYSTAKTEGTSSSVANTTTWNDWEEVSKTTAQLQPLKNNMDISFADPNPNKVALALGGTVVMGMTSIIGCGGTVVSLLGIVTAPLSPGAMTLCALGLAGTGIAYGQFVEELNDLKKDLAEKSSGGPNSCRLQPTPQPGELMCKPAEGIKILSNQNEVNSKGQEISTQNKPLGGGGTQFNIAQQSKVVANPLYQASFSVNRFVPTTTQSNGHSWGGAQTTTTEQYEEQTVTNGEQFSNEDAWGNATAADSAHTADLRFSYSVRNSGSEYARQLCGLMFNVYIGDDSNPAYSYSVANQIGGNGCYQNLMPNEAPHTYTANPIPLSLEQMKAIDLGGTLRIVVEDYNYGIDELFYQDAVSAGIQIAIEDGTDDGEEKIDTYILPTWGSEMVQDVLSRYFPNTVDASQNLTAIWTPEYLSDPPPAWCAAPIRTGTTLWCKHALSTVDWWNIYTNGMGDGTQALQDTPAAAGSTALFRFNKDTDQDGYSDRSELSLGTNPKNAASYPKPELIAGVHNIPSENNVISTLSLLNTGPYDAYGVEAVMVAPDDSITITNNTVGGSGRVGATRSVVVGSRIMAPQYTAAAWSGSAKPASGGYFNGSADRTYTFTVSCAVPAGCDVGSGTWSVSWNDGAGGSGTLNYGAGYASPTLLDVGAQGVKIGLLSGRAMNGNTFSVAAQTPRDTFQYTINREPHSEPVVIVSYNDPQGNHRFILPAAAMSLSAPAADLLSFSGQMVQDLGVEIVTSAAFAPGANTTTLLVNNPSGATLTDAHLFLEFIDPQGQVALEVPVTQTLPAGPSVVAVPWNTTAFSPVYTAGQDYIVMAFWTDYQGNILDTAGRPLSSFQVDPQPSLSTVQTEELWDFGSAAQGTLMQHQVTLASTGYMDLLTYVGTATGITLSGPSSKVLVPGDMAVYTLTVNTQDLPVGPFEQSIPLRTSDTQNPTRTLTIRGNITALPPDATTDSTLRPLDVTVTVPGAYSQGEWYEFTHTLGPNPQTLQPVKIYSQDYSTFWGVGKNATEFGVGTVPYMFGDGRDGDILVSTGQNLVINTVVTSASASGSTANPSSSNGFSAGDTVLFYQTQSTANLGRWELSQIVSLNSPTNWTLNKALAYSYNNTTGKAQVIRVPQYHNVTIQSGGILTAPAWDGNTGGILVFLANGTTTIDGMVKGDAIGYRGGRTGNGDNKFGVQGESIFGIGTEMQTANYSGGGGGYKVFGGRTGGGGGGSYATNGGNGQAVTNAPGGYGATSIYGVSDLSTMLFGGAGGGSGEAYGTTHPYNGGAGGGIIFINSATLMVTGSLSARGGTGQTSAHDDWGSGGGGAGGSILLRAQIATLGTSVSALGGSGGATGWGNGAGGNGGDGRIRLEFCNSQSGITNPVASTQKLTCYITEQVNTSPYTSSRLNIPESFANGRTYKAQFGRFYAFTGAGQNTQSIRLTKQIYTGATLDALVSNTGVASGPLNFSIDVGNDGTTDWYHNGQTTFPATLNVANTVTALNAYLVSRGDIDWGADIDVPVRVQIDRQADVLLTNLVLTVQTGQAQAGANRPLDWTATIPGSHTQGEAYDYTHTLGPDPASIQPCKLFDQSGSTLKGVGKYCSDYGGNTLPYQVFGTGTSDLTIPAGQTVYFDDVRSALSASGAPGQNSLSVVTTSGFTQNQEVIVIQMQGSGIGTYEFGEIQNVGSGSLTLKSNLIGSYNVGGNSKTQVIQIPQYRNVTIQGTLTAHAWDGSTGGLLIFRASGKVSVIDTGSINVTGLGFRGGPSSRGSAPGNGENGKQGEGTTGPGGGYSTNANGNGGGGGIGNEGGDGGGGGGNGANGTPGNTRHNIGNGGNGGFAGGNGNINIQTLGGGGGSGGGEGNSNSSSVSGAGGNGGGVIAIFSRILEVNGYIFSNGTPGGNATRVEEGSGGGGGGAGGSIFLEAQQATIATNHVLAFGGSGGAKGNPTGGAGDGGSGSIGKVNIIYQELTGSSTPPANTLNASFYVAEQIESTPFTTTRLYLPDTFANGQTYQVQYGRRFVFTGAGQQTSFLRLNRQMYTTASLDALVSNTGVASSPLNLCLDIGDDGTCDFTQNATTNFPATLAANNLASALNNYLLAQSAVAWGSPVDVPVRVQIDRQADVMLTNLALSPAGAKLRFLRLPAGSYSDIRVGLRFTQPGVPSGPLSFTVDVGADGSIDWSDAGTPAFPAIIQSNVNLAQAINAFLAGRTGEVDVPLRIIPSPFIETAVEVFTATPATLPDAALSATDITFGAVSPTEGSPVGIQAVMHNPGGRDSGPVTTSFFATPPGGSEWYLGSTLSANIPAGGTTPANFNWNTSGFTGSVPVRVQIDPYNRMGETSEANNQASSSLAILTRADLASSSIALNVAEPVANQTVTVAVTLNNNGETAAGTSTLALYDGDPAHGGTLVGETGLGMAGGANQNVTFNWTPASLGSHRLFAVSDRAGVVNESNEGNNQTWQDVYVGLPSPVLLDSGTGGDLAYTPTQGYGYLDEGQADAVGACGGGSQPADTQRRDPLGTVVYQFNHLQPGHFYHLDLTLYECDGAGRQESIYIDGNLVTGPVDLGDKQVHRLSLLLDPALYRDHLIRLEVSAPGIDGAVVSEVNLHDVDYRYADAGGTNDPEYPGSRGYGWMDGLASSNWGSLPYRSVRVSQGVGNNKLRYRFDNLQPGKSYKLNLVFWQLEGLGRILNINIDDVFTGLTVDTSDLQIHQHALQVPVSSYSADSSVVVTIERINSDTGAMINEISLEEQTLSPGTACTVQATPHFSIVYGDVISDGQPALPGTVVQALSPRGDTVGCYTVGASGKYGVLRLYGEDTSVSPVVRGLRDNDLVIFKVNGATATSNPLFYWHDDRLYSEVALQSGTVRGQSILLSPGWNLTSFNIEPAYPLVSLVLSSITTRYNWVLGENGSHSTLIEPQYNTLKELHSQRGYYIHSTSATSINLLTEGVPQLANSPISLHTGWNWIGYLPGSALPIAQALQSINGSYQLVHSMTQSYIPSRPEISDLSTMVPGGGYLIYMNSDATLIYPLTPDQPINPNQGSSSKPAGASACAGVQPTPSFTVVYGQVKLNGQPASPGTVVQMVTPRGEVVGCNVIQDLGVLKLTHVYGVDGLSTPGFQIDEPISFRVNGIASNPVQPLLWKGDLSLHEVDLNATGYILYLPFSAR